MLNDYKENLNQYRRQKRSDAGTPRAKYNSILPTRYRSFVNRANKKGIPFDMTIDEMNICLESDCVYCGKSRCGSVDRIDSTGGYTTDNIQPCCIDCNMMKHLFSTEVFVAQVKKIAKHLFLLDKQNYHID